MEGSQPDQGQHHDPHQPRRQRDPLHHDLHTRHQVCVRVCCGGEGGGWVSGEIDVSKLHDAAGAVVQVLIALLFIIIFIS